MTTYQPNPDQRAFGETDAFAALMKGKTFLAAGENHLLDASNSLAAIRYDAWSKDAERVLQLLKLAQARLDGLLRHVGEGRPE